MTTKWFSETLLATEMKKTKVEMDKPVYVGVSILGINKTLIYEFWCNYIKPKCQQNEKLCHIDTDRFIINVKTKYVYEDIDNDVEKRFNTVNYEIIDHYLQERMKKSLD